MIKVIILSLFFLSLLVIGLIGTGTELVFHYPGYLALGLTCVLGLMLWRRRPEFPPSDWCLLTAIGFIGYIVLRGALSPVVYIAREDILLALAAFCVYCLTALNFAHPRDRMAVFWCLVVLGAGNFIVGLIHFAGRPDFSIVPGYVREFGTGRSGGFFNNANHYAAFMTLAALLALAAVLFGRGGAPSKLVLLFLAALFVIGAGLSLSRAGIVGIAAGGGTLFVLSLYLARTLYAAHFRALAAVAVILFLGGGLGLGVMNFQKASGRFSGKGFIEGDTSRNYIWKAALRQAELGPVVGTGSRTFYHYGRKLRPEETPVHIPDFVYAHNEYLQLLGDYGLVGVALFGIFIASHLWRGARYLRWFVKTRYARTGQATSNQLALALGSLAGVAAMLAHAIFDFQLHSAALALPIAFACGVLANPGFEGLPSGDARLPGVRFFCKAAPVCLGAVLLYAGVRYGRAEYFFERTKVYADQESPLGLMILYNRAKQWDPWNPYVPRAKGQAWIGVIDPVMPPAVRESFAEKGVDSLREAQRLYPENIETLVALGNALDVSGEHGEAEAVFLEALNQGPLLLMTRLAYALHLHRTGRFDKAMEAYRQAGFGHVIPEEDTMDRLARFQWLLNKAIQRGDRDTAEPVPESKEEQEAAPDEAGGGPGTGF